MVVQDGTNSLVYGLDLISSTDGAGNRTYFSYDGLGSTSALTDAGCNVTDTYAYDVFGAVRARIGTNASPWKFTGEQADGAAGDSGYYFLRARYLDVATGRFISKDPIELDQRYAYVSGNPARWVDRTGTVGAPPDPVFRASDQICWFRGLSIGPIEEGRDCEVPAVQPGGLAPEGPLVLPIILPNGISVPKTRGPVPSGGYKAVLDEVESGSGNIGLGTWSRSDANDVGAAWVGPKFNVSRDGKAWYNDQKTKFYRPPTYKSRIGKVQANLELFSDGTRIVNGHLDIPGRLGE